jgi:hypothetical protein
MGPYRRRLLWVRFGPPKATIAPTNLSNPLCRYDSAKPILPHALTYWRLKQQYDALRGRWMGEVIGRFGIKA